MDANLLTCEWSPGSNRSLVDPVVAVAKLDMPAPTRAALIAKLQRHTFDDVVRIDWAGIRGAHDYEPDIRQMNFGPTGRLCLTVTRSTWKVEHEESAIVYLVGGRAFGYAAACGNLFELTRRERPTPRLVAAPDEPVDLLAQPVLPEPVLQGAELAPLDMPVPGVSALAPAWGSVTPVFYGSVPIAVAPVPEPSTWALFAVGGLMVWWRVLRARR